MRLTQLGLLVLALLLAGVLVGSSAAATPRKYRNCESLNRDYPHGIGRTGARDSTSGTPKVTTFHRSNSLYTLNSGRDRDGDGIACEKL